MKPFTFLSVALGGILGLGGMGCRKEAQVDATRQLQQSFQAAEPEVKKTMETVTINLNAGNYTEATRALAPVVSQRALTEPQKQAVGVALQQINQAIAANPKLDTKEMYELRARMFQATRGAQRF
jgi:hypothetical protein